MVESLKKIARMDIELTPEERNLLSVGYKNVIGERRASWRILCSLEQKEEVKGSEQNARRIREYKKKVENELSRICNDILLYKLYALLFHRACHLAKQAFDEAIPEINSLREDFDKDSTLILQLLKDNLTLWTSDLPEGGKRVWNLPSFEVSSTHLHNQLARPD
ncbi:hypothetical protein BHE74_00055856 [Ensete ventricosum]|nr:hypothetical protein GW17_00042038 [Ensete ventricosum]RWW38874.1 hypothetical protein BHE74_00055856 [Ensete ventricosum]